ncbi:hypothetical protein QT972_30970, partial [Microcoleus sp. herbarium7]|uniref:hypothetical protein n=1 Tax=Microcoleus sp. herbarium7 TaxID=3055435 RepID=UPI002FCF34FC
DTDSDESESSLIIQVKAERQFLIHSWSSREQRIPEDSLMKIYWYTRASFVYRPEQKWQT